MRILRAAGLVPQPWRNGRGTTRPIQEGEGWQIGVADLDGAADFSLFAGQDRAFTLLGGAGAVLDLAGRAPLACRPLVPALFPGDVPARYRPLGGPARALNVIVARGAVRARVQVASVAAGQAVPVGATALFCAEGRLAVGGSVLEPGDTALDPDAAGARAENGAENGAVVVLVHLARDGA